MKLIGAALMVIGVVGLVLTGVLPATFGVSGIPGAIAAIVSGLGFAMMGRCWNRNQ